MTCIVGFVHQNQFGQKQVYMGGDSSGLSGWDLTQRKDPKVFYVGKVVIGFTSSFRMGQILQHSFVPPDRTPGEDLYQYMCTRFIDEVRKVLHTKGFTERKNDREEGGQFLVGIEGRLFNVGSDFQVGENIHGFDAIGCGGSQAVGALAVLSALPNLAAKDVVLNALKIAEVFSGGVRGPFNVVSTMDYPGYAVDVVLDDGEDVFTKA